MSKLIDSWAEGYVKEAWGGAVNKEDLRKLILGER